MALNFGSLAETKVVTVNYLRPWNIYENVKFDGIEGPTTGTSANGNEWARYDIKFSCPEGIYKHSLFEPKTDERRTYPNANGHETQLPSELEVAMNLLTLIGSTFNPDGFKKVQENVSKCKDFETVIKLFNKFVGIPETTTSMKLVGRNSDGSVYANLPTFVRINSKDGSCFIPKGCVFGDNLGWSAWELGKIKEYNNAKPTPSPKEDTAVSGLEEESNDSLDDLLDL